MTVPSCQERKTSRTSVTESTASRSSPALGVGLHHGVLDAVVNHLREVAGADLARVDRAEIALGLQRVEDRLDLRDVLGGAAVHQRVAVLQAPDAAGDAAVDEADALLGELLRVLLVVRPARVAAVDDDVAGLQQLGQLVDRGLGRGTGGTITTPRADP